MRYAVFAVVLLLSASAEAQSIRCGIPPIPPIGCQTGPCVCDASGCHYLIIC